jgi:hypothetical protein
MSEEIVPHAVIVSLPRPQKPLPPRKFEGKGRFESFAAMVVDAWKEDSTPPSYAWVRYSLSAGIPLDSFIASFKRLSEIKHAFGLRVFVHPVRVDHHEVELGDFDHLTNPETGQYEIEANWRKKRCDGGSHIIFAVESTEEEGRRDHSVGQTALDALESLIRITLGAMIVVKTRQTLHVNLRTGLSVGDSPRFQTYGPEELPRSNEDSLDAATELADASAGLPAIVMGRLSLGMRWANVAFKNSDLLAFWTSLEILADCRGHAVYPKFAKAYGYSPRKSQVLAKELGLDVICKLRGDFAHSGVPVWMDPMGSSYLNALVHDLARDVAGLPCRRLARNALGDHRVEEWIRRETDGLDQRPGDRRT